MAFQIKDFVSISASMMNWLKATQSKVTDFNIGSTVRTMIEAIAAEIDELYQQMFVGLREGVEVSVYNSFSFDAITALPASGLIRVYVTASLSPIVIPAGTTFTPDVGSVTYTTATDFTIPISVAYIDVLVTCTENGTVGNILSGQNFTAAPAIVNFSSAINLASFFNGADDEMSDARKARFNAYISSLNRGTVAALRYGLNLANLTDSSGNITERVVSSSVIEPWLSDSSQPISLVKCYVHNGVGSTSSALVDRASVVIHGYYNADGTAVPGWKAAGTKVLVYAATETIVPVTGVLSALDGYDKPTIVAAAVQAIYTYIIGLKIGDNLVLSEVIKQVKEIDGVYDIVFSTPTASIAASNTTKFMPGAILIS